MEKWSSEAPFGMSCFSLVLFATENCRLLLTLSRIFKKSGIVTSVPLRTCEVTNGYRLGDSIKYTFSHRQIMLSFRKITIISCLFQLGRERIKEMSVTEHVHHAVVPKSE